MRKRKAGLGSWDTTECEAWLLWLQVTEAGSSKLNGRGQEWAGKYWQSTEGGAPQGLGMPETRAAPGLSQATISHLPWGGSKPRWLVVTPTQIQSSQGILMSAGSTLWERRDRGIPWPATPRGMYGIGEVELPEGKLVFCFPKGGEGVLGICTQQMFTPHGMSIERGGR